MAPDGYLKNTETGIRKIPCESHLHYPLLNPPADYFCVITLIGGKSVFEFRRRDVDPGYT